MTRLLVTAALAALAACATTGSARLDRELDAIAALLPGTYAGETENPRVPGERMAIFHRIAPIDAPRFGERVFFYQLTRDAPDGPVLQQKIFVLDTTPGRTVNRMVPYVVDPADGYRDLDRSPARWAALDPAAFMGFPAECAFQWTAEAGAYRAEVTRQRCRFTGRSFPTAIEPDMSYDLSESALVWSETLYAADGRVLVSTGGPRPARRL